MLIKLIKNLDNFMEWMHSVIIGWFKESPIVDTHYNPLSPTDEAEDCKIYFESFEWALSNRKTIRNIAIAGAYGSGKSSIIRTFIKQYKCSEWFFKRHLFPKYKFLNISLATFKDTKKINNAEINNTNTETEESNNELLRLIELSILQQLFFHEEDSKIPDSRFKKIKNQRKIKLFSYSVGFISFLISILFLLTPDFLAKFSLFNIPERFSETARYCASIVTIVGSFCLIHKSSRSLIGLSIKKLNINNAEIEIDEGISKSILNNHLDEIIYFFEATKYNVVIIEDLDRFEQTEVFTKLREINLLVNSSNKIKREVVFIYAIKDDMFLDKDRAKFFDYMIPIIPVINYSNSGAKLRKIVKDNKYHISEELLDDLSMFIDDMRLLYNIMNEFYIYSKKVESNLDQNKLLSMIVYKNIFPNDFTLLGQNEGDIYKTIVNKSQYIKAKNLELDNQILIIKAKIARVEEHKIFDLKELRTIYITKVIEKIAANGFVGFDDNYQIEKISNFCDDINFNKILSGVVSYYYRNSNSNHTNTYSFKFADIEKEVNSKLSYKEREELILNKNQINDFKKEIETINEQKVQVQKSRLKDLLSNKQILIETDSIKKGDLINILLRNGYIDENYMDYISIFHEGALTKLDYQFLINIKIEKQSDFDYKLIKIEELLKKISEFAFEKEFVLNFNLVDALLQSSNQKIKKQRLFQQLSNEKKGVLSFIDEFIDSTVNIELFISEICIYWTNIWNFIYSKTHYSEERIDKYFKLIIQYAQVKDIAKIFQDNTNFINNYSSFLNIPVKKEKLEQIIDTLNLKFNFIDIDSQDLMLNYIITKNNYTINIEMIRTLLSFKKLFEVERFEKMNYSYILSTKLQPIIDYIESNIDEYIEIVYLRLDNNTEEKIESYIKLLNNEDLNIDLKENIIIKVNTIIEEIPKVDNSDVYDLLFKHSKVKPTWENILVSFEIEENILNKDVLSFLNSISNSDVLSKIRMSTDKIGGKVIYNALCKAIIHNSEINLESYKLLIKSIPWWYESFDVGELSEDRVIVLIENNKVNPTVESYDFLNKNFKGTNVLLLEKHLNTYKELSNEFLIDKDDLELILKSKKIETTDKFIFINSCKDDIILDNPENVKIVAALLADYDIYKVRNTLKLSLIKNVNIPVTIRIKIFNKVTSLLNKGIINEFLDSLGGEYSGIRDTNKKATLGNNTLNRKLLDNLDQLDYISSVSEVRKGLRVNHWRKE